MYSHIDETNNHIANPNTFIKNIHLGVNGITFTTAKNCSFVNRRVHNDNNVEFRSNIFENIQ